MKFNIVVKIILIFIFPALHSCAPATLSGFYRSYSPGLSQEYGAYYFEKNGNFKYRWTSDMISDNAMGSGTYKIKKGEIHLEFKKSPSIIQTTSNNTKKDSSVLSIILEQVGGDLHHGLYKSNKEAHDVEVFITNTKTHNNHYENKKIKIGEKLSIPIDVDLYPNQATISMYGSSSTIDFYEKNNFTLRISQVDGILYLNNISKDNLKVRKWGKKIWVNDRKFIKSKNVDQWLLHW